MIRVKGKDRRRRPTLPPFSHGFSLVELIIVIGVIALMLGAISPVIVSQYRKGQAGKAIATIEALREAVGHYVEMTGAVSFSDITVNELIEKRIIPGSFRSGKNPWGGIYDLSESDNGSTYTITLTKVPGWAGEDYLKSTYDTTSNCDYDPSTQNLTLKFR